MPKTNLAVNISQQSNSYAENSTPNRFVSAKQVNPLVFASQQASNCLYHPYSTNRPTVIMQSDAMQPNSYSGPTRNELEFKNRHGTVLSAVGFTMPIYSAQMTQSSITSNHELYYQLFIQFSSVSDHLRYSFARFDRTISPKLSLGRFDGDSVQWPEWAGPVCSPAQK